MFFYPFKILIQACLIAAALACPAVAFSQWSKIASSEFAVPAPPDEQATSHEIEILLQFQNEQSTQQCELGRKQERPGFNVFFEDVSFFTTKQFQSIQPLMNRVSQFGERVATYFKNKYHRTRPFNFDSRIVPCVPLPVGNTSYPSSHAAVATLNACILGHIFPNLASQFAQTGTEDSERRLQIGVHFPSDVKAGQNLAHEICQRLLQEPDFQRDLENLDTK